ncbi:MAG: SIMPL domain-containing protein [Candidatus Micrarchaeota archaeon]|nr:SIMPL domain-containing protein [Candidatus Micrarchaeota archaeon]MDE1848040.1 SIMPL domain-containing protein [Candidatus Micrarchaeota archaeon]MDE1864729.1 SIMPL domain-containing protein [Candidatus Micrarchaeota archaeon]
MAGKNLGSNVALVLSVIALLVVVEVAFIGFPKEQGPFISVIASGVAYGYPDQALIYISVNGSGSTAASAAANLSATMGALNTTIAAYLDNNLSLLQTQYYSNKMVQRILCSNYTAVPFGNAASQKQLYCASLQPAGTVAGSTCCYNVSQYVAEESIAATIPSINSVDGALSAISGIPNVDVQGTNQQFSSSRAGALMQSALAGALANATSQARLLAGSARQVQIVNITVQGSAYFYPMGLASVSGASSSGSSTFYPGRNAVVRSVSVLFREV